MGELGRQVQFKGTQTDTHLRQFTQYKEFTAQWGTQALFTTSNCPVVRQTS